ncbi:MAG: ABC transporter ATP-binding protein [Candidatus Thorarchaeota archaeon]
MLMNLTIGELAFGLFFIILDSVILFFVVRALMGWYAKKRSWYIQMEEQIGVSPRKTTLKVSLVWLILYFPLQFLFFLFLSTNIIKDLIIVAIEVVVLTFVAMRFYDKDLRETFIFIIITQALVFLIGYIIDLVMGVYFITLSLPNDQELTSSAGFYYFCFILILGISVFYVNWGDKIQFVKDKNIILILSVAPGIIVMSYLFNTQRDIFISNFAVNLIWGLVVSIISATVLKIIFQSRLSFEKIRDLTILEPNKKILDVQDLKVYYPLIGGMLKRKFGNVKAVDGITFNIKTGETLGLVGESGCGKTTVANAILGLVPKEAGDIIFSGDSIPNEYPKVLRRKIQIVFQDPDASLNPRMKIVDILAEPLKNLLGITKGEEIRKRVLRLLEEVSLKREHMDRFPHEFSGGQKQRIIIARALASNPELIILDEPTSALDVSVQAQILNLLKELQKTYGYGFLFITHNLAVVNHIADRVAVMYLGKIVEVGSTDQIFSNPTHPYTIALLESRTELDPSNKEIRFVIKGEVPSPIAPPPGCTFNPRCISDARTSDCMRELPHKIKIEEGHYIWCVNPPISMQKRASVEHGRSNILEN